MTSPSPPAALPSPPTGSPVLRPLFAGLATLTALATLRTLVLPPWPAASSLPPAGVLQRGMAEAGLRPIARPVSPARREAERALSPGFNWQLEDGEILRLQHGSVRRWDDLQLAILNRGLPKLAMKNRRLGRDARGLPFAEGALASGLARQTCLVPASRAEPPFGVTYQQLTAVHEQRITSLNQRLTALLGLRPPRTYDCVIISLEAPHGRSPSPATWDRVIAALRPILAPRGGSPSL